MRCMLLGCGSRTWPDLVRAGHELRRYPGFELMHGACSPRRDGTPGGDEALDRAALAAGLVPGETLHRRPADWNRYPTAAGPLRNRAMQTECRAILDAGGMVEGLALGALEKLDPKRPGSAKATGTGGMVALLRELGVRVRWVPAPDAEAQTLALRVYTARLNQYLRDTDALNITRQTGGPAGSPFAPSWDLLKPVIAARRQAVALADEAIAEDAWAAYAPAFVEEMRGSYRQHRGAWRSLLARDRVVLTCVCPTRERCHRGLVAGILAKLGALDMGELAPVEPQQLRMPGT